MESRIANLLDSTDSHSSTNSITFECMNVSYLSVGANLNYSLKHQPKEKQSKSSYLHSP